MVVFLAKLWFAKYAAIEIGSAISSFSPSSTIQTQMTALANEYTYTGMVKDIKISGGERDAETLKLLGYNELLEEKRATIVECVFTLAAQGAIKAFNSAATRSTNLDTAEMIMGVKQTVTGNYMRATGGEKASNDRTSKAVHFKLADGTNTISVLLNNALGTSRDYSLAADGSEEESITFKCLASNYAEEDDYA